MPLLYQQLTACLKYLLYQAFFGGGFRLSITEKVGKNWVLEFLLSFCDEKNWVLSWNSIEFFKIIDSKNLRHKNCRNWSLMTPQYLLGTFWRKPAYTFSQNLRKIEFLVKFRLNSGKKLSFGEKIEFFFHWVLAPTHKKKAWRTVSSCYLHSKDKM